MSDLERFSHFLKGKMFEKMSLQWIRGDMGDQWFLLHGKVPTTHEYISPAHVQKAYHGELVIISWSFKQFRYLVAGDVSTKNPPRCCRTERVKESKHHPSPGIEIRDDWRDPNAFKKKLVTLVIHFSPYCQNSVFYFLDRKKSRLFWWWQGGGWGGVG